MSNQENKRSDLLTDTENETIIHLLGKKCQTPSLVWEQELSMKFKYNPVGSCFHTFAADGCNAGLNFSSEHEAAFFRHQIEVSLEMRQQKIQDRKDRRKKLYNVIGLTEKQMADKKTMKLVHNFVRSQGGVEAVTKAIEDERDTAGGAPSPPPSRGSVPPLPPKMGAPPPPLSRSAGPSPPPPMGGPPVPPPLTVPGAPPPTPPVRDRPGDSRSHSLSEIRGGANLKKGCNAGLNLSSENEIEVSLEMRQQKIQDRKDKWKKLYTVIGVTEKQMADKKTMKFFHDFVRSQGGVEAVTKAIEDITDTAGGAPSPPPSRGSVPPLPPKKGAPPPPISRSAGPPPPPPMGGPPEPPPLTVPGAPPPPPPVGDRPGDSRSHSLSEIRGGANLKKVTQEDGEPKAEAPVVGILGAHQQVLQIRTNAIHSSDDDSDSETNFDSNDDEWND